MKRLSWFFVTTIRVFFAVAIILLWLFTGERQVPFAANVISYLTNQNLTEYHIDLDKTTFHWLGYNDGLRISAKSLILKEKNTGNVLSSIPNASIVLHHDGQHAVVKHIAIDNVQWHIPVAQPQLESAPLFIADGKDGEEENEAELPNMVQTLLDSEGFNAVQSLTIRNAQIAVEYDATAPAITIPLKQLAIQKQAEKYVVQGLCITGQQAFTVRGEVTRSAEGGLHIAGDVEDIALQSLWQMLSRDAEWEHIPITVQMDMAASISPAGYFERADISFANVGKGMPIDGEVKIRHAGEIILNGEMHFGRFAVSELADIWPPSIAPKTRKWTLERITNAMFTDGTLAFDYDGGAAVKGQFDFTKADVNYRGKKFALPPVQNASGTLRITPDMLAADMQSGTMLNSALSNSRFELHKPGTEEVYFTLEADTKGPVADILVFVKELLRKNTAVQSLLQKYQVQQGTATSRLSMWSPMKPNKKPEDHHVTATSIITDLVIAHKGDAIAFDALDVKLNQFDDTHPTSIVVENKAVVMGAQLQRLNIPLMQYIDGALDAVATLTVKEKQPAWNIVANAAAAELHVPIIGLKKTAGKAATMRAQFDQLKNKKGRLKQMQIEGSGLDIEGSGRFSQVKGQDFAFDFSKLAYGRTKASAEFTRKNGRYFIDAQGSQLDMLPIMQHRNAQPKQPATATQTPYEMTLKTNRLLYKDTVLENVKFEYNNQPQRVHYRDKDGSDFTLKDSQMNGTIKNLGAVLTMLGKGRELYGGELAITTRALEQGRYWAAVQLKKFRVKKLPILAELLNFASFTSLINLLDNKGVGFKKLKADLTYAPKGLMEIKELRAYGGAVGITAEGTYHLGNDQLRVEGSLIPAYNLNKLVGEIPILGDIITGGDEALLASNYKMKGTLSDPKIIVNPLTMLTPGFLRKLWELDD